MRLPRVSLRAADSAEYARRTTGRISEPGIRYRRTGRSTRRLLASEVSAPNAPKLRRGGQEARVLATRESAAPAAQFCAGRMAGPLSPAALLLGGESCTSVGGIPVPDHLDSSSERISLSARASSFESGGISTVGRFSWCVVTYGRVVTIMGTYG